MAPRGPAKAREYDYSNVGKAGRRTGITLKEGKRDEHGMEEIEGMFSSPEKSPANENGFYNDAGNEMGSDGMSIDEGNAPGPADFLNGRRGSYFPPPVARSPMKTGLAGSPRRTPGLRSSASPQRGQPSSSPSDAKTLGNAKTGSRQDASPLTNRSVNAPSSNHSNGLRNKTKGNNKPPESAAAVDFSDSDANSQFDGGDENAESFEPKHHDSADSFAAGDDTMMSDQTPQITDEPARNGVDPDSPSDSESRKPEQPKASTKAKRSALGDKKRPQDILQQNGTDEQESAPKPKRAGRPPKAQSKANEEPEEQRPSKKAKTSVDQANQGVKKSGNPQLDQIVENYANRAGPLKARSLHILKREVPTEDSSNRTRSGRVSIRPLAFWKNEKCVFGDEEAVEGQRYPLSTIKEVHRTEELEPERKRAKKNKRQYSKKSKKSKDIESENEDDDEDADAWEKEGAGVLHGYIRRWNPATQTAVEGDDEVLDIAYAPSGIETRDVKDSTFRFAKLLSSPFIGSGIVELPPGGVKRPKNSKRMHMVFYVCHGRVQIDISGVKFGAGKGCVFQVPRGNYYSFENTHGFDARLFFTQGCVPGENDNTASESASKQALLEGESTEDVPRPTKGRPKGSKATKDTQSAKGPNLKGPKGPKGPKGSKQKAGGGSKAS